MKMSAVGLAALCVMLAGCAGNGTIPSAVKLDSGIGVTGSAGMSGGPAAPPAGAGNVSSTTVAR
jgi:hypothetical protein